MEPGLPAEPRRTIEEELQYIEKINEVTYEIKKGFVPGMLTEARFFVCLLEVWVTLLG
jgi:hypothetical protein